MKLPEFLFKFINPCMALLLRSPLHRILSGSVMVIYFTGRKSGRQLYTPVRYLRQGNTVRCFTGTEGKWWHNFKTPADVQLLVRGEQVNAKAQASRGEEAGVRAKLEAFLARFPQDAIYHEIHIKEGRLVEADVVKALPHVVMVEFEVH